MDLKPGDVVTLKSGGHPLTVVEVNEDAVGACGWAAKAICSAKRCRWQSSNSPHQTRIRRTRRMKTRTRKMKNDEDDEEARKKTLRPGSSSQRCRPEQRHRL